MKYFLVALIAIMITSCHNQPSDKMEVQSLDRKVNDLDKVANATVSDSTTTVTNAPVPTVLNSGSPDWDKKIIKTANINLELKNYNSFNNAIHQSLKNYGAYVAQEQQLQSEDQLSNTVNIKVPVDQFDNLVNYLSSIDANAKVLDKQISSEDVSTQIVDTKSRVETKKKLRDKYFELMGQSKKMDDVIRVQNEINTITEDIEAASSRVEYLSHQSAYSTLNLKYYQILDAAKVDDAAPGFFANVVKAFKQGGSIITGCILFFVNIWPLLLAGIALWYFIKRSKFMKPKADQGV